MSHLRRALGGVGRRERFQTPAVPEARRPWGKPLVTAGEKAGNSFLRTAGLQGRLSHTVSMALTHPLCFELLKIGVMTDQTIRGRGWGMPPLHGKLRQLKLGELSGEMGLYGGVGGQDIFPKPRPFLLWPLQNGQCWFRQTRTQTSPVLALPFITHRTLTRVSLQVSCLPKRCRDSGCGLHMDGSLPPSCTWLPGSSQGLWADSQLASQAGAAVRPWGAVLGLFFSPCCFLYQSLVFLLCKMGPGKTVM